MRLIQAQSAIIFQPIFGDLRNNPDGVFRSRQIDQYVLQKH